MHMHLEAGLHSAAPDYQLLPGKRTASKSLTAGALFGIDPEMGSCNYLLQACRLGETLLNETNETHEDRIAAACTPVL